MDTYGRKLIITALELDPVVGPASKGTVEVYPDDEAIEERGGHVRYVAINAGYLSTHVEAIFEALRANELLSDGNNQPAGPGPFLERMNIYPNPNGSQTLLFRDLTASPEPV